MVLSSRLNKPCSCSVETFHSSYRPCRRSSRQNHKCLKSLHHRSSAPCRGSDHQLNLFVTLVKCEIVNRPKLFIFKLHVLYCFCVGLEMFFKDTKPQILNFLNHKITKVFRKEPLYDLTQTKLPTLRRFKNVTGCGV